MRIYWSTELLCSRSKPIPLHGRKCPTCAAELQPARERDVMLLPAPMDLSQLCGEGNDTTARCYGVGRESAFLLQHEGMAQEDGSVSRLHFQSLSWQSTGKENTAPLNVLAIPLNHAELVVENFRYFSNLLTLHRASRNSSGKGN